MEALCLCLCLYICIWVNPNVSLYFGLTKSNSKSENPHSNLDSNLNFRPKSKSKWFGRREREFERIQIRFRFRAWTGIRERARMILRGFLITTQSSFKWEQKYRIIASLGKLSNKATAFEWWNKHDGDQERTIHTEREKSPIYQVVICVTLGIRTRRIELFQLLFLFLLPLLDISNISKLREWWFEIWNWLQNIEQQKLTSWVRRNCTFEASLDLGLNEKRAIEWEEEEPE